MRGKERPNSFPVVLAMATFKNLPKALDLKFNKIINKLIVLQQKNEQNKALENYFQRNSLFELQEFTKKKKTRIKSKMKKLFKSALYQCEKKLVLHKQCVQTLTHHIKVYRHFMY